MIDRAAAIQQRLAELAIEIRRTGEEIARLRPLAFSRRTDEAATAAGKRLEDLSTQGEELGEETTRLFNELAGLGRR